MRKLILFILLTFSISFGFSCTLSSVKEQYPNHRVGSELYNGQVYNGYYQPTYDQHGNIHDVFVPVCVADDVVPPDQSASEVYDAWKRCEVGKSSPLVIASPSQLEWLGGRPVQRLICDQPPIDELVYFDNWDDYASGTNPKFVDWDGDSPNPKPDPDPDPDPDPIPTPPSTGDITGTITTETSPNGSGGTTSTSTVDVKLEFDSDFLTQEQLGNTIDDKYKKWRDGNLGDISQANYGLFNTLSDLESSLPNLIPTSEIDPSVDDFAFSFNVVAQCPAPYTYNLSLMGYTWTMTFYYTWICDFALAISYLVMASAYLSAGYIYLGLRR